MNEISIKKRSKMYGGIFVKKRTYMQKHVCSKKRKERKKRREKREEKKREESSS
jgi:hypothetical protein